jgi:hypothetical protein
MAVLSKRRLILVGAFILVRRVIPFLNFARYEEGLHDG